MPRASDAPEESGRIEVRDLGAAAEEAAEVEAVERRFLASATGPVAADERELMEEGRGATEFGVRDMVDEGLPEVEVVAEAAGFLAAAAEPMVEVLFSLLGEPTALAPLLGTAEVRRIDLLDSSSEADTLGRERWVAVDEMLLAGLRTVLVEVLEVPPGGRVGGLARPPATRVVAEEVLAGLVAVVLVDEAVVGRRTVEEVAVAAPELEPGFFREEAVETVDFVLGEDGAGLGVSSCWTTSKLPASDILAVGGDRVTARRERVSVDGWVLLTRVKVSWRRSKRGSRIAAGVGRHSKGRVGRVEGEAEGDDLAGITAFLAAEGIGELHWRPQEGNWVVGRGGLNRLDP